MSQYWIPGTTITTLISTSLLINDKPLKYFCIGLSCLIGLIIDTVTLPFCGLYNFNNWLEEYEPL